MDVDLEELVKSFEGYGIESWMKTSYLVMAKQVQELRDVLRGRNVSNNKNLDPKPLEPSGGISRAPCILLFVYLVTVKIQQGSW